MRFSHSHILLLSYLIFYRLENGEVRGGDCYVHSEIHLNGVLSINAILTRLLYLHTILTYGIHGICSLAHKYTQSQINTIDAVVTTVAAAVAANTRAQNRHTVV